MSDKPKKVPMTLLVDDSCPLVHVLRYQHNDAHGGPPLTQDGRPLVDTIPNAFLDRFCDVVERNGMAGKFSIIPSPAGRGDVVRGIEGFDPALTRAWLDTAKARLGGRFDFTPEILTHTRALDLDTGRYYEQNESDWSQTQNRRSLERYLATALDLLQQAGVQPTGITSCWVFGERVEAEYLAAMAAALKQVCDLDFGWYYLHIWDAYPSSRPHIAYAQGKTVLVSINSTVDDYFWETIEVGRTDEDFINHVTDSFLTEDGREGAVRRVVDAGGWPVFMTHWQSYFSNGNETGLAVLDRLGRRITATMKDEVEWVSCSEMARRTVQEFSER
jgi:hypothetical protein